MIQSPSSGPTAQRRGVITDRRTAVRLAVVVVAIVILMILIGVITYFPAQTITTTIQDQYTEQQKLLAGSLARQMENYFNGLANELLSLSTRSSVQSIFGARDEALTAITEVGGRNQGLIRAVVRIAADGTPRYAYPAEYNARIEAGQELPWSLTEESAEQIIKGRGVQLVRRSSGTGAVYLLVIPLQAGLNRIELLAFELQLEGYLNSTFGSVDLGETGQLWIFDRFGSEIYKFRLEPLFRGGTAQFLNVTETALFREYPSPDRLSIVVPVYTAFTEDRGGVASLILILSRTILEANLIVQDTLSALFLFSIGVITFVVLFGILIGIYLLRESARRRRAETRRATANTLLDLSRTMNSSLDVNIVLRRILDNLEQVMPHDNASILLLSDDRLTVQIAAESGMFFTDNQRKVVPLGDVGAAKLVLDSGAPVVINDTLNDTRWSPVPGSNIRAWLGVPLRLRDAAVGVLNINSAAPSRFTPEDSNVAQAFADQAGVAIQNARAHELTVSAYEMELETARAIQVSLLPQEPPPLDDVEWAVRSIPARQVSGDYHQYFVLPDGRLGIAVGDVSGKGIPAALLMAVISTALRDEILRKRAPSDVLSELNTRLLPRFKQNKMNSALILAMYDPQTSLVEIASGGMLSPYVCSAGTWAEVELSGYPLGAAASPTYNPKVVKLAPGAMMIFLSDGVIEAQNQDRELYGYDRFERLLASLPGHISAEQVADAILKSVREHLHDHDPQDDITIVIFKVKELKGERVR